MVLRFNVRVSFLFSVRVPKFGSTELEHKIKKEVLDYFAGVVGERSGVIQRQTNEEHGQPPSNGGEHALPSVQVGVLFAQHVEDGRVGQRHTRTAEELADDDQQQEQKEHFADVVPVEDRVRERRWYLEPQKGNEMSWNIISTEG